MAQWTLVLEGMRSGENRFAEELARTAQPVWKRSARRAGSAAYCWIAGRSGAHQVKAEAIPPWPCARQTISWEGGWV